MRTTTALLETETGGSATDGVDPSLIQLYPIRAAPQGESRRGTAHCRDGTLMGGPGTAGRAGSARPQKRAAQRRGALCGGTISCCRSAKGRERLAGGVVAALVLGIGELGGIDRVQGMAGLDDLFRRALGQGRRQTDAR
jgi:hypothetical protein